MEAWVTPCSDIERATERREGDRFERRVLLPELSSPTRRTVRSFLELKKRFGLKVDFSSEVSCWPIVM